MTIDNWQFLLLPSKGIISKIVLRDYDLLFEDQTFKMLISMKRWVLAQKCAERLLQTWIFVNEWYHCGIYAYDFHKEFIVGRM